MRSYSDKTKARIRELLANKERKPAARLQSKMARSAADQSNSVLILGAGIAGLCCAFELERLGYSVTILEAQTDHLGGRIRTFRCGEATCEFGAMRIPESHDLTLKYISDFGLQTRQFVQQNPRSFGFIRGQKVTRTDNGYESLKPLFPLADEEQNLSVDDLWVESVVELLDGLTALQQKELYGNTLTTAQLREIDQESLYNELRKKGYTRAAIEYVSSVYGVTTYLETGLSEHLREEHDGIWIGKFREIVGGMDQLVEQFRKRINGKIIQGAVVTEIVNNEAEPTINFTHEGSSKKLTADWVICTIPLGVLSRMDIDRAFSAEKINAIRNVNYDSSSKIISKSTKRFWETDDHIFGGGSIWDGGLGHTWYPSDNAEEKSSEVSNSPSLLLSSYTWGMHARRIDAIPDHSVHEYVVNELKQIHSTANEKTITESHRWSWDNHEWSSGAFTFFNPGDHTDLHQELVRVEDRVLLAGEHCSLTHSWIQGSMESALNACNHIILN